MRWSETPIHFIDFEGNLTSGVLEYGVVTLQGGRVIDTQTGVCGAVGRIRPADTAIHGLAASHVSLHAPFREEFGRFAALRESGPLAAHFANAENTLIKSTWPYPRLSPDFARPGGQVADWGPWIDTGRLLPQLFRGVQSSKLEDLVTAFGLADRLDDVAKAVCPVGRRQYHAALYDALAGALLLLALGERPEFREMTVPWLLQLSTLDPDRRAALQQDELF